MAKPEWINIRICPTTNVLISDNLPVRAVPEMFASPPGTAASFFYYGRPHTVKIRKQRLPSFRKIKKYGPPYFRCKTMVCGKNMVCRQNIFAVHKCSDTHIHKNMSLISHKTSIFHYRNVFGNMLCLPVFPASEIDNPLCLVCVQ